MDTCFSQNNRMNTLLTPPHIGSTHGRTPSNRRAILALILVTLFSLFTIACSKQDKSSQDLPEETPLETGLRELRAFNFNEAHATLLQVHQELSPESADWPLATYSFAIATWHQSPSTAQASDDAALLFQLIVDTTPEHTLAASALLDLGRISELNPTEDSTVTALAYYQRVQDEYPGTEMAIRACLFQAQALARTADPDSIRQAISILEAMIQAQPDSKWLGALEQYAAHLYAFYLNDVDSALLHYTRVEAAGWPRPAEADLSLWQLGLLQQEVNHDLEAAKTFTTIVKEYPRSVYGTLARERIVEIASKHPQAGITIPELAKVKLGR